MKSPVPIGPDALRSSAALVSMFVFSLAAVAAFLVACYSVVRRAYSMNARALPVVAPVAPGV